MEVNPLGETEESGQREGCCAVHMCPVDITPKFSLLCNCGHEQLADVCLLDSIPSICVWKQIPWGRGTTLDAALSPPE